MARDWRRLALAVLAAFAVALTGVVGVHAQSAAKKPAAKAQAKEQQKADADDDEEGQLKPQTPKRKKQDPVEAQRAVDSAAKLIEAGKSEQAAQSLTTVLSGGNLPSAIFAKALLYRGMAYRQQQKPAQAISDLTSAMWLKGGLSPSDRTSALEQRKAAYQEAGLTESGEALVVARPQTIAQDKERPAPASTTTSGGWSGTTSVATAPEQSSQSGSGWNLFGGLFGGSGGGSSSSSSWQTTDAKAAPKPALEARPAPEPRKVAVAEPQASSWASGTEVRSTAPREIVETGSIQVRPEGKFRIQIAMVRSQDEALAVATKIKREYAAVAAGEPEIDQTVVGNMGSFYRVRVGPYASQSEGQAACAKLRGSGLDCLVVTQ